MLTIYRRHRKACKHRDKGRDHRHCQCPIWVDGYLGGKEMRESLKMRDWQRAQETVREWEAEDRRPLQPERKTVVDGWKAFLADIEARKLADGTVRKYKFLDRQMEDFCLRHGFKFLDELDLSNVSKFRAEWKDGPRSRREENWNGCAPFFVSHRKRKWIPDNPASDLTSPKVTLCPTLPFSHEEMVRIPGGN